MMSGSSLVVHLQTGHGRQADIWSLGATILEMATGKPPWAEYSSQVAAMFHIAVSEDPPQYPVRRWCPVCYVPHCSMNRAASGCFALVFLIVRRACLCRVQPKMSKDAYHFLDLCFIRDFRKRPNAARLLKHPFVDNMVRVSQTTPLSSSLFPRLHFSIWKRQTNQYQSVCCW